MLVAGVNGGSSLPNRDALRAVRSGSRTRSGSSTSASSAITSTCSSRRMTGGRCGPGCGCSESRVRSSSTQRSARRGKRRRGTVFTDRYYARILKTPREVRNCLSCVSSRRATASITAAAIACCVSGSLESLATSAIPTQYRVDVPRSTHAFPLPDGSRSKSKEPRSAGRFAGRARSRRRGRPLATCASSSPCSCRASCPRWPKALGR
jgi:hypothetical protein